MTARKDAPMDDYRQASYVGPGDELPDGTVLYEAMPPVVVNANDPAVASLVAAGRLIVAI